MLKLDVFRLVSSNAVKGINTRLAGVLSFYLISSKIVFFSKKGTIKDTVNI